MKNLKRYESPIETTVPDYQSPTKKELIFMDALVIVDDIEDVRVTTPDGKLDLTAYIKRYTLDALERQALEYAEEDY